MVLVIMIITIFTATLADFSTLSPLSQTFVTGSGHGAQMCTSWEAGTDDLVEGDEEFTITLTLANSGTTFHLENSATTVIILDINGMIIAHK